MPKRSCFRTAFGSQGFHELETLLKSAWQDFYPNFPLILDKLSWKTSPLIRSEILGLFVNTLMAAHMYSRRNWEKISHRVKTQLSQ